LLRPQEPDLLWLDVEPLSRFSSADDLLEAASDPREDGERPAVLSLRVLQL